MAVESSQFAWYLAKTNKHYVGGLTTEYELGTFTRNGLYRFDSITDTGFNLTVISNYHDLNLIIIAFA